MTPLRTLLRRIVIAVVLCLPSLAAAQPLEFKDAAEEKRFQALTRELRCLVCQNQSLADSDAGLANDLRREVFEQMRSGKNDEDIKKYLVARYSEFVLYDPPLSRSTVLLWFGPAVMVVIGGIVVALAVRRRKAATATGPATAAPGEEEDW
ncbi:cytochrome c-type biogenesis protein [Tahibacter amnicola]|uniref:Cytochrome c-type biogenesis protein n=1 Tax=Tahibacter amnicola TaxID=2976241 RepID=A0ABY6BD48_9GAMM|nr:cytochrome c-type biogenesis protein [Tahibacter amnicola]UXI67040.1 cytochrome c-type biogenesis protein CcmH [Tahibacter amnicola]